MAGAWSSRSSSQSSSILLNLACPWEAAARLGLGLSVPYISNGATLTWNIQDSLPLEDILCERRGEKRRESVVNCCDSKRPLRGQAKSESYPRSWATSLVLI